MRSMRKYCDGEKIYLKILTALHIFSAPDYEKVLRTQSTSIDLYIYVRLVSA
jgi:hypothetical protein